MHPKNSTKLSKTQLPDIQDNDPRGFIYYRVDVHLDGCRTQGLPIMWLGLAVELHEMLRCEHSEGRVVIQQVGCELSELNDIRRIAEKHKELVISVRDADHPGREYLARLARICESAPATQNVEPQNVSRHAEVRP